MPSSTVINFTQEHLEDFLNYVLGSDNNCPPEIDRLDYFIHKTLIHIESSKTLMNAFDSLHQEDLTRIRRTAEILLKQRFIDDEDPTFLVNSGWVSSTRKIIDVIDTLEKQRKMEDSADLYEYLWMDETVKEFESMCKYVPDTNPADFIRFELLCKVLEERSAKHIYSNLPSEEKTIVYEVARKIISLKQELSDKPPHEMQLIKKYIEKAESLLKTLSVSEPGINVSTDPKNDEDAEKSSNDDGNDKGLMRFVFDVSDRIFDLVESGDEDVPPGFEPWSFRRFDMLANFTNLGELEDILSNMTKSKRDGICKVAERIPELLEKKSLEDKSPWAPKMLSASVNIIEVLNKIEHDNENRDQHTQQTD